MKQSFFTSWPSVVIFLIVGILVLRLAIKTSGGLFSTRMKLYLGGIGAIAFSIALLVSKLLGKI